MTDFFDGLYANDQLKTYIQMKISDGALPHALIFEGPIGSGKTTATIMTVQSLDPEYASKIGKLSTPDVTLHEPTDGKKSIGISIIREIRSAAFIKPQELSVRVFIIRQAHTMTTEAQNALLKILEEPPRGVYFFLLCENASLLLPTVRSRAPVLKMSILPDEELAKYMVQTSKKAEVMYQNSPEDFLMLIRSCGGSIGCATERIGSPASDAERQRARTLELITLLSEGKRDKILLFFVKSRMSREELSEILLMLCYALRDMLKLKYGELEQALYFTSLEDAENFSSTFARSTLMNLYSVADGLRGKLAVNVSVDAFSVRCADVLTDAAQK